MCSVQCACAACWWRAAQCTSKGVAHGCFCRGLVLPSYFSGRQTALQKSPCREAPTEKPSQRSPCRKAPANEILQRSPHRRALAKRPLQKGPRCCIGTPANSVEGRPPCKKSPCRKAPSEKSCRKQNRVSDHLGEVPLDRKSAKEGKWSQLELCTENSSCCCNFFQ